ncbi:MAG: hypothetical protein V8R91_10050 [Butyricimonas faecihominis]
MEGCSTGDEVYYSESVQLVFLPDFVSREDFEWAVREATIKKKTDFSKVEFLRDDEGTRGGDKEPERRFRLFG